MLSVLLDRARRLRRWGTSGLPPVSSHDEAVEVAKDAATRLEAVQAALDGRAYTFDKVAPRYCLHAINAIACMVRGGYNVTFPSRPQEREWIVMLSRDNDARFYSDQLSLHSAILNAHDAVCKEPVCRKERE